MLYYVLICLCLVLTGIAGLQMAYMFYLDRLDKERKRRLRQLERRCRALTARLERAEERLAEQDAMLDAFGVVPEEEDNWADVIE
jgi:hypothetical protein